MPGTKASFVMGANCRVPTPPAFTSPSEGILRLTFHIQDENGVIPTVVTRELGPVGEATHVPQQAFLVAPMAHIALASTRRPSLLHTSATTHPSSAGAPTDREASQADTSRGVVPAPAPHIDVAGLTLTGYAPGYKDHNQDSALMLDTFLSNRQQLLAVFDGHGPEGHRVSTFARRNLPFTLLTQLVEEGASSSATAAATSTSTVRAPADISAHTAAGSAAGTGDACGGADGDADGCGGGPLPRALWRTVASLDRQLEESGIDVINSGTTAALCHVHGRRVTAAWVGDSRVLLGLRARGAGAPQQRGLQDEGSAAPEAANGASASAAAATAVSSGTRGGGGGWRVAWCSTDHKPELPGEARRIEAAGGRVARSVGRQGPVGPYRVWFQDQAYPGLAMSRALGDLPGRQIGVTCAPSCASLRLPDSGPAVLVLASDGVWELLSNEQVLELATSARSAAEAASRLVQQSRRAWVKEYGGSYVDDITAIVMRIDVPSQGRAGTGAGAGTGAAR